MEGKVSASCTLILVIITSGVDDFGKVEVKSAPANMSQYIREHTEKREENRIKNKK